MIEKLLAAITQYNMLARSRCVTVALSGGADSVALLHALLSVKDKLSLEIRAAHLNHCLRGAESDRDEAFVTSLCERLGVPLTVERADIKAECEKTGESTELCARRIRYDFLERVAAGGVVATAHTASDSAETMLFNLTRGTALKGLCGIPACRGIFIRPLIFATRAEIEAYCEKNGIDFVTDSSNLSDDYNRNKIRHKVVPYLKGINDSLENTMSRTAKILSDDNSFLNEVASGLYTEVRTDCGIDAQRLKSAHIALVRRVIVQYLTECEIEASSLMVEQIIGILGGGCVMLAKGRVFEVKNGVLSEKRCVPAPEFSVEYSVVDRIIFENNAKINSLLLNNALDYDKISGVVVLRNRISGDKIRLKNRGVTKTLKKLFTENATPLNFRESLPVLADDLGPVWVHGFGIAERVAIDNKTKNILLVKSEIIGG